MDRLNKFFVFEGWFQVFSEVHSNNGIYDLRGEFSEFTITKKTFVLLLKLVDEFSSTIYDYYTLRKQYT